MFKKSKITLLLWIVFLAGCAGLQTKQSSSSVKSGDKSNSAIVGSEIEKSQNKSQVKEEKSEEVILNHRYFTISYNKIHRLANWVKYVLKKEDLNGPGIRPKKFKPDPLLKEKNIIAVVHEDYTHLDERIPRDSTLEERKSCQK